MTILKKKSLAVIAAAMLLSQGATTGSAWAESEQTAQSHLNDPVFLERQEAVKKLEAGGETQELARALFSLGKYHFEVLDEPAQAEKLFRRALDIQRAKHDPWQETMIGFSIACVLVLSGQAEKATQEFNNAHAVALANKDAVLYRDYRGIKDAIAEKLSEDLYNILFNLGSTLLTANRVEEAERFFNEAKLMNPQASEKVDIALNFASIAQRRGQYDNALSILQQAYKEETHKTDKEAGQDKEILATGLTATPQMGDDEARLLIAMAKIKQMVGDLSGATELVSKVLADQGLGMSEQHLIDARLLRAESLSRQQKYEEAKKLLAAAVEIGRPYARDNVIRPLLSKSLIALGNTESELGDFDAAQKHIGEALELNRKEGDRNRTIDAAIHMAILNLRKGQPEPALTSLLPIKAAMPRNINPEVKGSMLTSIAACYQALGEPDNAIRFYKEALKVFGEINDPGLTAPALNSLAVVYLDSGKLADFEKLYTDAKALYSKLNDAQDEAVLDYNYAQSLTIQAFNSQSNDYSQAISTYKTALDRANKADDIAVAGTILRGLATAELLSGSTESALQHYLESLKLADQGSSIEAKWDANLGVGKAYKMLNKLVESEPYLRKAVDLVELERNKLSRDSFKTHNLDFRKDCFIELTDVLVRTGKTWEALEIVERGRARAFLDLLANRKTKRVELAQVTPKEAPLLVASLPPSTSPFPQAGEQGTRAIMVTPKMTVSVVEETAISPINADPPPQKEIKEILAKRKSTCVEYFAMNEKLIAFVAKPDDTLNAIEVPIKHAELNQKLERAYNAIIKPPPQGDDQKRHAYGLQRQQNLRELHKILIEPIKQYLPTDNNEMVTFVPHGMLFNLPFAALIDSDGAYLIEKHTISYTPAIGVLRATQRLAAETKTDQPELFAVGNPMTPEVAAVIGALPYAEKEVKNIAQLFGTHATIKVGGEATKPVFMSLAPKASTIHLATHGLIDGLHPMQSALVLAPQPGKIDDDGLLTVKDIMTMPPIKANLVVLSACQTGRGKITGDGVVGLSRAFVIAGTPSVVVSQWNVDDIMTEFQMKQFYKSYLSGHDKAKALRDAQIATVRFLEQTPEGQAPKHAADYVRANPRYWAAFELIGEP